MITPRISSQKVIQKFRDQTQQYYDGWSKAEKIAAKRGNLYNYSIGLLVNTIKDKKELENKPPEIKEVIIEKEIVKKIPYPKEVIKEVVKEVPVEVVKEVEKIKEVFVPTKDLKAEKAWQERLEGERKKYKKDILNLQEDFDSQLKREKIFRSALKKSYQTAILHAREEERKEVEARIPKQSGWVSTYIYLLSVFSLTQVLWMVCL